MKTFPRKSRISQIPIVFRYTRYKYELENIDTFALCCTFIHEVFSPHPQGSIQQFYSIQCSVGTSVQLTDLVNVQCENVPNTCTNPIRALSEVFNEALLSVRYYY